MLKAGIKPLIGNKGYRHFLKLNGARAEIDRQALEREARYDGKYVLRTNADLDTGAAALAST
ncbi:MAG: hypothetical protein ACOYU7_03275 [Bacillota bacterium]